MVDFLDRFLLFSQLECGYIRRLNRKDVLEKTANHFGMRGYKVYRDMLIFRKVIDNLIDKDYH